MNAGTEAVLTGALSGGASGAAAGPHGAAIGAAVGVIGALSNPTTDPNPPVFREFIRATGSGAFEAWAKSAGRVASYTSKDVILPDFYKWLLSTGKSPGWWTTNGSMYENTAYIAGTSEAAFSAMGYDYAKSAEAYAKGAGAQAWVRSSGTGGAQKLWDDNTYTGTVGFNPWLVLLGFGSLVALYFWTRTDTNTTVKRKKANW